MHQKMGKIRLNLIRGGNLYVIHSVRLNKVDWVELCRLCKS